MPVWKSAIAALVFVVGASNSVLAQSQKSFNGGATGSYPATQTLGNLSEFYGMTPNFNNYGLSGSYPSYGGYGYPAYGPGAQFGAHFPSSPASKAPPTSRKPTVSTNRKPTGKPGASGYGTDRANPLPRKGL